ncbi:putative peroxiredoxin YgaF [Planktothrix sp. PCC 11201]|nr:putative peroxiredoxin YgaF [Planktothrix sp. PCC 11201]
MDITLNPGDLAPDFVLPDSDGNPVGLSDFRGKTVVLYFYPRDNTPGCTKEACGFRDNYGEYQEKNIIVLGISTDNSAAHRKFINKYQLPFPLLVDEGGKVATEYGSYGLKKFMGKEFMGVFRHTFVIDTEGLIKTIYRKVKPETHSLEILQTLDKP